MKSRSMMVIVLAVLLVLPGVEAWGGEYLRNPPTSSDMIVHEGNQKTIVVQIMNLTPYDIQLKNTNFDSDLHDRWIKMNRRMKDIGVEAYFLETKDLPRYQ